MNKDFKVKSGLVTGGAAAVNGALTVSSTSGTTFGGSAVYTGYASAIVVNYPGNQTTYGITLIPASVTSATNAFAFLSSASTPAVPVQVAAIQHLSGNAGMNLQGTWTYGNNAILTAASTYAGTLTSSQVTTALGFTPGLGGGSVTSVGGTGTVSGLTLTGTVTTSGSLSLGGALTLTSAQVTTALTFTPYNATNPSGYTANAGTVTSVSVATANGASGSVATSTTTPVVTLAFVTQVYGDATTNVATTAFVDQFRDVAANPQAGAYQLVLSDRGKCIDANGNVTIPANGTVAFPVGAVIGFTNVSATAITIAITTDTLHLAGTATVGTRTLASWGMATARKVSSTVWVITGAGVT